MCTLTELYCVFIRIHQTSKGRFLYTGQTQIRSSVTPPAGQSGHRRFPEEQDERQRRVKTSRGSLHGPADVDSPWKTTRKQLLVRKHSSGLHPVASCHFRATGLEKRVRQTMELIQADTSSLFIQLHSVPSRPPQGTSGP